jgi:membrane protease YdiL (CAAX protease family)
MTPRRVVAFALATQGLLILIAWLASSLVRHPFPWGAPLRDTTIGLAAALLLGAVNYLLLEHAPPNWLADGVRGVYRELLVPLFGRINGLSVIVIGAAAGLGEEWLFRGVVQPALGLVGASLVFGLAHFGGRQMVPFAVWACGMGLALGGLAIVTGGLIAPIVAHGTYDMLALEYIRRGAHRT